MATITSNTDEDEVTYQDNQIDNVLEELEQEEAEIENMSEVELRLEEANYFKALLKNPLFSDTDSAIAARVEKRVRNFIQSELRVLLGLETPKKVDVFKSNFTPEEEKVLKALASKVLIKEKAETKSEPVVNVATVPQPTAPKPAPAPKPVEVSAQPPKAKGRPVKKTEEKPASKAAEKKIKTVVNTPQGPMEVEVSAPRGQTRPAPGTPGMLPALTEAEIYNTMSQQAFSETPNGGLIGLALQATNPHLLGQLVVDKGDDE